MVLQRPPTDIVLSKIICCHSAGQQEQCVTQGSSHLLEIHDEVNTNHGVVMLRGAVNKTLIFADTLLIVILL